MYAYVCASRQLYSMYVQYIYTQNITTEAGYCIIAASLRLNFILMDNYLEERV